MNGADPSSVDKIRAAIRNLDTQIKVSIHSVESISKRIENLRDEELQPQLLELVEGYVYDIRLTVLTRSILANYSNAMIFLSKLSCSPNPSIQVPLMIESSKTFYIDFSIANKVRHFTLLTSC